MKSQIIRPIALGIFRKDDTILVFEGYDKNKNQCFYRSPGGGIEFGEPGHVALTREIQEEFNARIMEPHYLGMLESIFWYQGEKGHEIALLYEARFQDTHWYCTPTINGYEDTGEPFTCIWKELNSFNPITPLYPAGLLAMLK
ncbi:MAG TPA: NUDIX domain-containing protein [Thermoflexia bacterium]|nr:NUDIX domain-containing protein [Thermoflexia bacterium]